MHTVIADAGLSNTGNANTFTASGTQGYVITSKSKSGNTFTVTKAAATGAVTRTCDTAGSTKGGCNGTSW